MNQLIETQTMENLVFEFRGIKVMIDIDLAILYETETKRLREQIKRNQERFPSDFMFQLTAEEKEQLIILSPRLEKLKFAATNPIVFTEQGIAMLSSILNSPRAIQINIEIMRAFSRYRALLMENTELKKEIKALDEKLNQAFQFLLEKIDALTPQYTGRKSIGYKK